MKICMNIICRHCDELIVSKAYRVTSEADGVPLLDIIVCGSCAAVAKSLLLKTDEIKVEQGPSSASAGDMSDQLCHGRALSTSH